MAHPILQVSAPLSSPRRRYRADGSTVHLGAKERSGGEQR